ncbi:MAG TPA: AraC family transcriptional regulator ligand-binding domain-containing protein, partial [Novosphingobium sp.]|nr:AraC family transcriptional regulator ligand-binding domain-containing protein [Novosphingobium sp.]
QEQAFFTLPGPLDALPAEGQMRAANLHGFHEVVARLGGDSRAILERFGIDALLIRNADYFVDCQALGSAFEYCSEKLGESRFGLVLAQAQSPDVFGLVTAICRAAPTFGEAIECFVRYLPVVHSPVSALELVVGQETSELRFSGTASVQGFEGCQIMYEAGLLIARLLNEVGGRAFRPSYVSLRELASRKDASEIERIFECPYRPSQAANAIGFPTWMLSQPVPNASRQLYLLLQGYLERLRQATRQSLVERLEDCIVSSFGAGDCSLEWCAGKLGLSPRALRMRLGQRDLKFSDLVERKRRDLALEYLSRPDVSLDEVAFALGYSEQSAFGRAFKRWTGTTPQAHRARPA